LLVLITPLLSALLAQGRTASRLAANIRDAASAEAAADGAINTAIFELLDANGWIADGAPHRLVVGRSTVTVQVRSLAGSINPNLASTPLLAGLFEALGQPQPQAQALAVAVIAWRSPAATGAAREALFAAYRRAGLPYGPPARPFSDLSELAWINGMTPALMAAMAPHVSLYQSGDPDATLADPVVRAALKFSGQAGAQAGVYEGNAPVAEIEAQALGPGKTTLRRSAVVSLPGNGPSLFRTLRVND
jgi:general secretion pathway protein K